MVSWRLASIKPDPADVEDIASGGRSVHMVRKIRERRPSSAERRSASWSSIDAQTRAIDYWRARQRRNRHVADLGGEVPDVATPEEDALVHAEVMAEIIQDLGPRDQRILIERYVVGLAPAEMADRLGVARRDHRYRPLAGARKAAHRPARDRCKKSHRRGGLKVMDHPEDDRLNETALRAHDDAALEAVRFELARDRPTAASVRIAAVLAERASTTIVATCRELGAHRGVGPKGIGLAIRDAQARIQMRLRQPERLPLHRAACRRDRARLH